MRKPRANHPLRIVEDMTFAVEDYFTAGYLDIEELREVYSLLEKMETEDSREYTEALARIVEIWVKGFHKMRGD